MIIHTDRRVTDRRVIMIDIRQQSIREKLNDMAEEKYRIFTQSLNPGKTNILGVRLPALRKLSKEIVKGDWRAYLREAKEVPMERLSMEEVLLQGMVIGNCKADLTEVLKLTAEFIPLIDCWSVCDSFCSGLKIANRYKKEFWDFLQPYLLSEQEYEIRFGVVMLLNYYVLPEYASLAFAHFDRIQHEGYYVKMAVAWAISMYYVKLSEQTLEYLKNNCLDKFTYNKALQKITESLRVDKETKDMIRGMKRK